MELGQRSTMNSIVGSLQGDSPPRSTYGHHTRQLSSISYSGRPPSIQGSLRPSTSRSIRSIYLGTPCAHSTTLFVLDYFFMVRDAYNVRFYTKFYCYSKVFVSILNCYRNFKVMKKNKNTYMLLKYLYFIYLH